ncbi:MAG: hypothetical protein B6D64_10975 [Bacteroidetes bacterium 4484_276]|nr:MAG: hypothetical protein B6D64_10975 [Bacteroidetes bacterium 4484_276]
MEDKSDIEILKEFAKSTGREIVAKELPYRRTGIRTTQKYKRMVYIPNNPAKTSIFVWFNDPYTRVGQQTIFSGAFIPISSRIKSKLVIRPSIFLDKLNFFSKTKANKLGNRKFDSKVTISGKMDTESKRLLSHSRLQYQILRALEIESYISISINELKIDFVPELSQTSIFSIINRHGWDIDKNIIEKVFSSIEKIKSIIE